MNLSGAKDRPDIEQIWDNVEAKLQDKPEVHKTLSTYGFFETIYGKIMGFK
jgi:hypothetical protein